MDLDINGQWIVEHADDAAFYICKADTSNFYGAEIPAVVALIDAAPAMLAVLRRLEWSGRQLEAGVARCPICGQSERNPHTPACVLGAVIAKATGV